MSPKSIEIGKEIARAVFGKRGNPGAIELSEVDLSELLAIAAEKAALLMVLAAVRRIEGER